jgi:hypothetical protein
VGTWISEDPNIRFSHLPTIEGPFRVEAIGTGSHASEAE